jgi:hypothetical protein
MNFVKIFFGDFRSKVGVDVGGWAEIPSYAIVVKTLPLAAVSSGRIIGVCLFAPVIG